MLLHKCVHKCLSWNVSVRIETGGLEGPKDLELVRVEIESNGNCTTKSPCYPNSGQCCARIKRVATQKLDQVT